MAESLPETPLSTSLNETRVGWLGTEVVMVVTVELSWPIVKADCGKPPAKLACPTTLPAEVKVNVPMPLDSE